MRLALPYPDISTTSFSRPQNIAMNWTRTISPTIINEARVGLNRAVFITDNASDWSTIWARPTVNLVSVERRPFPASVNVRLGSGLSDIGSVGIIEDNVTNTFHYGDNLTLSPGAID